MKKNFILPLIALGAFTFTSCGNNQPEPVQLTLISEWGSFNDEYPTPKLTLNTLKSTKFKDVQGIMEPKPFFPNVHTFKGWTFDTQGTNPVPDDYVINENTTVYANYEYDPKEPNTSYIVYNVGYNNEDDGRNVLQFAYEGKADEIKVEEREQIEDYVISEESKSPYTVQTLTFTKKSENIGPCLIKIKGQINNLKLANKTGIYTLGNEYVTAVLLSDTITTISNCAFDSCYWLMAIHLPDSIKTIPYGAFNLCYSLNFLEMPKNLETIEESAFFGCATMEHAYFNNSLKTIGPRAFMGCASLKEIHIPDSVTSLGDEAFCWCLTNNDLRIGKGVKVIPYYCFSQNYYLQKVTIPNTVDVLGTACFEHCDSLIEVNFEDGGTPITDVKNINSSFQYCISLSKIKLPNRMKTLGRWTFAHTLLYELDLTSCDGVVDFGSWPFAHDTPIKYGYGKIIVPNNLVDAYKGAEGWKEHASIIVGQ